MNSDIIDISDNPLVVEFVNWILGIDSNTIVSHTSWNVCFVGQFHKFKNNIDSDVLVYGDDMEIYHELLKIEEQKITLLTRVCRYDTFGELQKWIIENLTGY